MNLFDSIINAAAPVHGVRRMAARKALRMMNSGYGSHGANLHKKSVLGWMYRGGSPKEDIEDNLDVLRQRSRDVYMGAPAAAAMLKTLRTNVIAGGLIPSPLIDADFLKLDAEQTQRLQAQISREFDLWAEKTTCDADGLDNFYGLQQLAFLSYIMNGDTFALLPVRRDKGDVYSLKIRLVEADRVCSPNGYDRLEPCEVDGHRVENIVQGVETDKTGRVTAYWICSRHPLSHMANLSHGLEWTRVEARGGASKRRNVLHVMTRERAGQIRGVPLLAPVLETLKQMDRYTEAEVTAAEIGAMLTVFIESEELHADNPIGEAVPEEQRLDEMDQASIEMGNGTVVGLAPGEKAKMLDPTHPNTAYDIFADAIYKLTGAATEIPMEVFTKRFVASYSAARGALNEFWRTCGMYRDWFVDDFCQPVYEEWFAEAVARGRIQAPGFFSDPAVRRAYTACAWNGPSRTSLDPEAEVKAAALRVQYGFSTAQDETAQLTGGDYMKNMKQRQIEARLKREVDEILYPDEAVGQELLKPSKSSGGKSTRREEQEEQEQEERKRREAEG